jgi:hypothetical protein
MWARVFLAALARTPNVSAAAKAAGVTRQATYARRKVAPEFAEAWDDALEASTDALIGEVYRRALEGVEEPVFHEGKVCGHKRRYSDALAMFLLRAHRPEVYGDRSRLDLTSAGQALASPVVIYLPDNGRADVRSLSDDQLRAIAEATGDS